MIFCRFRSSGAREARYGVVENHSVSEISPNPFEKFETTGDPIPLSEVELLAPVFPSKIVAIGVNYADHAKEMGHSRPENPILFLKPPTAVIGAQEAIRYPEMAGRVD